jgi:hypothetical protein
MLTSSYHPFIRVFLSSTRLDLHRERLLVRRALETIDCFVETMERWSPATRPPVDVIKDRIARSNIFVLSRHAVSECSPSPTLCQLTSRVLLRELSS